VPWIDPSRAGCAGTRGVARASPPERSDKLGVEPPTVREYTPTGGRPKASLGEDLKGQRMRVRVKGLLPGESQSPTNPVWPCRGRTMGDQFTRGNQHRVPGRGRRGSTS
jgi:hypothetical protein